jgi:protein SCO1/2
MAGFGRIFCISINLACALAARSYPVDGLVVSVNPPVLTVAHRPIKGYMPAMTMDFRAASSKELEPVRVGKRVRFEFRDGLARGIRIVPPDEKDMPAAATPPQIGGPAPDFQLVDQNNREVTLSSLRGKVVALNFLYTRCPMPEVCPRLAANFASVQRRFPEAVGQGLVLLSITIDPQWDTPEVLASYAKLWRAKSDGWHFLTGTPDAVKAVATAWGLVYWPEEGAIAHTSRTAIIGREGKLLAMVEGSSYRTDQLIELIRHQLESNK